MNLRKQYVIGLAIAALMLATGGRIPAQEQKPFSPAIEQLRETDINSLTPLAALQLLAELAERARSV